MDLFMEVTNLMQGNTTWAHYTLTGYYPPSIRGDFFKSQKKKIISTPVGVALKQCI